MTDKTQEKACSNCNKLIEATKYRLHESTCRRNTYKCTKCGEVLPKCMQEQHDFEQHDVVSEMLADSS